MPPVSQVYVFDVFELDEHAQALWSEDKPVDLTNAEYLLLLFFVKNPKVKHSYGDLYEEVFGLDGKSEDNTIPNHVSNIRIKLRKHSRKNFFKNIPNFGYRFEADIFIKEKSRRLQVIKEEPDGDENEIQIENEISDSADNNEEAFNETADERESFSNPELSEKRQKTTAIGGIVLAAVLLAVGSLTLDYSEIGFGKIIFIVIAGVCYGILNVIGLILECAYEFDKYKKKILRMALTVFSFNAAAVFAGFVLTDKLLKTDSIAGFGVGLAFLLTSAVLTSTCGYFVLPNKPIAKARVQTQPAFAAFFKNVFLYFLPLWSVFFLLIFCLLYGNSPATKSFIILSLLAAICLAAFGGSLYSTFYFTDKLLMEKDGQEYQYYNLYFFLLMARAVLFFGPTGLAVIWYLIFVLN
jgi:DNA-binding winged helix-turn-helix (wHTH) protein